MRNRSFLVPVVAGLLAMDFSEGVSLGQGFQIQVQIQGGNVQAAPVPVLAAARSERAEVNAIEVDQARLRSAFLSTDTKGLVNFFRLRAKGEPSQGTLDQLIESLNAPLPAARRQACADLVAIGTPALPLLRAAARDSQARAELVQHCLNTIESDGGTLTAAAARLLVHCHSADAAGVLLAFLPHAENEVVLEELQNVLTALAYDEKGVADVAVVKALEDKRALVRRTALVVLADSDISPYQQQLRKLLLDPAPSVRWRAALTLAQADDAEAISTMIALLGELADPEARTTVEDFLIELAGELGPKARLGAGEATPAKAREAWAEWWRQTNSVGLLEELKKRNVSEAFHNRIQALIRKLGNDDFRVREQTQAELIRLGEPALPLLKKAMQDPDPEIRQRSDRCLASINVTKDTFRARLPVMARLIALHKPPGAAEAILAYLPSLDDEGLREELQHALNTVAFSDGKPNPALLKALSDKSGIRRTAAAQALCATPSADHPQAVRGLLVDPELAVRLKVALSLARSGDLSAVDGLIALVGELPAEQSRQAEDCLQQLVGEAGPKDLPDAEANREKRSKIWVAWWQANKGKVALTDSRSTMREWLGCGSNPRTVRGYTLLVQPNSNTVTELRPDGKPYWTLPGLAQPQDAQVLKGGQRVLVAEQNRVTERDLRGKILWQKESLAQPVSVQRLPNGNTFIACAGGNQLLEVDRRGKEVLKVACPIGFGQNASVRKLRNGQIVAFNGSQVIQLDKTGQLLKSAPVQCGGGGQNEVTEDGHVLALSPGFGHLQEFDADGKQLHDFAVAGAGNACRLSNGNTLVIAEGQTKCIELDKNWKPIKETNLPAPAFRVRGR